MNSTARQLHITAHSRISVALAVLGLMLVSAGAIASSLNVNNGASRTGDFGLEVSVDSTCTGNTNLVLDNEGTVTVDQQGCETLTAGNNTEVSGTVTFSAGSTIVFDNGFSVAQSSDFTAALDSAMAQYAWVQDDSPADEVTYHVEFWIDADNLSVGGGDEIEHFVAYYGGVPQMRVVMESGPQLVLEVWDDVDALHTSSAVSLSSGWNKVNISWEAAFGATASIAVNDGTPAELTGLDTDASRIATVRWGAVGGSLDGTTGSMNQDDFASWR